VKYAAIAPTFREVVPVQVKITKAGNILIQTMSVTQLMENIRERSKTKLGKKLYNGDQTTMLRDVEAMLALHKKKKETLPYFKEKYGDDVGETYRNFLNTLFGLMTKDQQNLNPMFETEGVRYSSNVFKSRRLDRINHTARLVGRPALPFGYEQVKVNLFPVGLPEGDIRGVATPSPAITPEMDAADRAANREKNTLVEKIASTLQSGKPYVFRGPDGRDFLFTRSSKPNQPFQVTHRDKQGPMADTPIYSLDSLASDAGPEISEILSADRPDIPDDTGFNTEYSNRVFLYEMKGRPAGPKAVPSGFLQSKSGGRYGISAFDRILTEKEINDFELKPIGFRESLDEWLKQ
jgi:hypothetical protein